MKKYAGFGWMELIVGILLIALGVLTFVRPDSILTGIVLLYGLIAILMGIEDILIYVRLEKYTGFGPALSLISGIMSVMCGIMLMAYPEAGKWAISLLFPVWFIAHCISRLAHLDRQRLFGGFCYCFSCAANAIGVVLGFLMLFRPVLSFMTMRAIGYVVAVYLVLLGVESVVLAFSHRCTLW